MFRLDNLPPPEVFLESIGLDSYGHHACRTSTPTEYHYSWTPPPLKVDQALLDTYQSALASSGKIDGLTHEILGLSEGIEERLRAQLHLYQAFVGDLVCKKLFVKELRLLEQVNNIDDISKTIGDWRRHFIPAFEAYGL